MTTKGERREEKRRKQGERQNQGKKAKLWVQLEWQRTEAARAKRDGR